jgi:PAS domain S-box-containing protein
LSGPLGIKSLLVTALYPKIGAPWVFGLHHCRASRAWSIAERRLFQEIGRRIADALRSLLVVRQLQESEQRLRDAERLAHVGYWQTDYVRNVITWSDETYRIHGLAPNSPLELDDLSRRIHPEDRERVATSVQSTLDGGPRHDLEFRAVRPDGDIRVLHSQGDVVRDASGRALRFFGTVQDITERRLAEQAMIESHNLLNSVIEGTTDMVFVKDIQGRYLLINSAGVRVAGRPAEEIIGRTDRDVLPPNMAESVEQSDRELIASGESKTYELSDSRGDQTKTWLISKSIFRDARGNPIGLIGLCRDVTELKRLEEQLRQAQKMEAVGRLAGGIAHDFNNILTVINGFSRLIFDRLPDDDENREALAEVMKSGERAANLTRQLLAFSRKQRLWPQIVSVNPLLGGLSKLLRALIGEDIVLTVTPDERLGPVRLDPGQFEQAIINLAVNARDAMPDGGRLTIETSERDIDEIYAQSNPDVHPGRYVCVTVSDSGVGMDDATEARIFEPFFTTKEQGKGTGLGLAMVYGFVRQSGGHIDVRSAPGAGTSFTIYLPIAARAESAEIDNRAQLGPPKGTETVLLVEDEAAVRALIRAVLESNGYTVLEAADGEGGVALAAGYDAPIDLLVTDLVMPRRGGRQLAEVLRRTRPNIRVLFMSGYTEQPVDHGSGGCDAFLQKPFSPLELARTLRGILDRPN